MKGSQVDGAFQTGKSLNSVALQNAVLCAECDVVGDSPHDQCLVCGSHSLFNIARMFGGNLPRSRASLIASEELETTHREIVLSFPGGHRLRKKGARLSRRAASSSCEKSSMSTWTRSTLRSSS